MVALGVAALGLFMVPARSQTAGDSLIDPAAASLRSDPVYVAPAARFALTPVEAKALRDRIGRSDAGPVYVAVLPDRARLEAGGSADALLELIGRGVNRPGTYAVVVGNELRAGATPDTPFEQGVVPALAEEAVSAQRGGDANAVLTDFVGRLDEAAAEGGEAPNGGLGTALVLLLIGGVGFLALASWRRRARDRRAAAAHFEEVREAALEDLVALGEDLRALDLDIEMPGANPEAKRDFEKALSCYEQASASLDRARHTHDLRDVSSALDEGRYAIAATRARLDGGEPPQRRPPCFFDPRHGPSVRDVQWAPPGGRARAVPVCADDARRVEEGLEPRARQVRVGDGSRPYWDAPGYYAPWAGGYFGGFGFFEGLLLGSFLDPDLGGGDLGPSEEGGFGDFGGGDFGGGDFGGGDFGGGDFGG
jgi:hypothetical protein